MGLRNWANISESAGQVELKVVSSPTSKLVRLPMNKNFSQTMSLFKLFHWSKY